MNGIQRPRGHDPIVAKLEELAAAASRGPDEPIPHAWLFTGASGVGKATMARWWSARLKCRDGDDCRGLCASCKRVAAGSHPDLCLVNVPEDKKHIGIDPVRRAATEMAIKPVAAGPRVAIIDPANQMTTEAQSAILKLLEEPPGWAVIVLVTDNPASLLPTIRSRCQRLGFGRLAEADMFAILAAHGLDEDAARERLAVSGNNLGLALSRDAAALESLATLRRRLAALSEEPWESESLAVELAERRKKDPALDGLLLDWRLEEFRHALAKGRGLVTADATLEALSALARNANPRLALRTLLLGRGRR